MPCLACGVLGSVLFLTRGQMGQPSGSVALFVVRIGCLRNSQTPSEMVNWNAVDWSLSSTEPSIRGCAVVPRPALDSWFAEKGNRSVGLENHWWILLL